MIAHHKLLSRLSHFSDGNWHNVFSSLRGMSGDSTISFARAMMALIEIGCCYGSGWLEDDEKTNSANKEQVWLRITNEGRKVLDESL